MDSRVMMLFSLVLLFADFSPVLTEIREQIIVICIVLVGILVLHIHQFWCLDKKIFKTKIKAENGGIRIEPEVELRGGGELKDLNQMNKTQKVVELSTLKEENK